ncbi:MAG: 30S ribosomal protein S6 [uncultured bacterium]|nr:MAG: 30S ribosomal protein S6 [uncultured bacterium]
MEHYELMFVLPGSLDPATVLAVQARVDDYIQNASGTTTTKVDLERRRLAYKIGQQTHGYYSIRQFDIEPAKIKDIDQKLHLENEVLRYMLVKAPVMTAEAIKEMMAGEKYKIVKPVPVVVAPKEAKTSVTALTEDEKLFAEAHVAKVDVDTEKNKVSIEELDKKLDAILEDTDLASKL